MRTTRESWSLNMPSPYNYLHALKYSRMNGDVKHQTQIVALCVYLACHHIVFTHTGSETETLCVLFVRTRSLGALRAPTSSWRPFGPLSLDFVLRALRALRPVRQARFRSGPVKTGHFERKNWHFLKKRKFLQNGALLYCIVRKENVQTLAWLFHFQCLAWLRPRSEFLSLSANLDWLSSCLCSFSLPPLGILISSCMEMNDRTFFDTYLGVGEANSLSSFELRLLHAVPFRLLLLMNMIFVRLNQTELHRLVLL